MGTDAIAALARQAAYKSVGMEKQAFMGMGRMMPGLMRAGQRFMGGAGRQMAQRGAQRAAQAAPKMNLGGQIGNKIGQGFGWAARNPGKTAAGAAAGWTGIDAAQGAMGGWEGQDSLGWHRARMGNSGLLGGLGAMAMNPAKTIASPFHWMMGGDRGPQSVQGAEQSKMLREYQDPRTGQMVQVNRVSRPNIYRPDIQAAYDRMKADREMLPPELRRQFGGGGDSQGGARAASYGSSSGRPFTYNYDYLLNRG